VRLIAIGGSDAGISAALRARELDPSVEVTVVVADAYPNFSICGIPYYISGEVSHWTNLAHRSIADLEATGMQLLAERGLDCLLLGARTPAESLVRAVRDTAAAAVILVCHLTTGRQAAVDALRSAELNQTSIYYAGGAFASHQARNGVPGHHLGDNLTNAADSIANALQNPSMSTAPET
jgi:hypothetical protein